MGLPLLAARSDTQQLGEDPTQRLVFAVTRWGVSTIVNSLWQDVLGRQCPVGVKTPFVDVADNTHEGSIDCLYGLDITKGTTAVTYGPGEKLKASQISQFLVRIYEKAGNNCAVSGEGLARAVACLAALRIIPSEAEGSSFGSVTRDQMAVYMVGLWHNMAGWGLPPRPPARPADGTYTAVSAGLYLSCGLRSDGAIECWGSNEDGQSDVPGGVQRGLSWRRAFVWFALRRDRRMLGQQRIHPGERA